MEDMVSEWMCFCAQVETLAHVCGEEEEEEVGRVEEFSVLKWKWKTGSRQNKDAAKSIRGERPRLIVGLQERLNEQTQ